MQPQMAQLIQQGLSKQNLHELTVFSEALINSKPAIYYSLAKIFAYLEEEYEAHDALDASRTADINSSLCQPLLDLLDAEDRSAGVILHSLDSVIVAFQKLT